MREHMRISNLCEIYGEPNFTVDNMPVWILQENKGIILTHGDITPFIVSEKHRMFDVWFEGGFVNYGDRCFDAYIDYTVEKELLR